MPDGWVDGGRRPRSVDPDDGDLYGSHWWTRDNPYGTFWAAGHEGQYIDVCPALDLVMVRMGRTDAEHGEHLKRWRTEVIEAFGAADLIRGVAGAGSGGYTPSQSPTGAWPTR